LVILVVCVLIAANVVLLLYPVFGRDHGCHNFASRHRSQAAAEG
jgi:hypothetical protein